MSDQPDFAALAQEYLDLWEDQLAAMAADPALAEQGARLLETMGQLGNQVSPMANAQMMGMMQQFMALAGAMGGAAPGHGTAGPTATPFANPFAAFTAPGATGAPPRAAPAAAPPDDRDQRLDELARRLAALEDRLVQLESGADTTRREPRTETRSAGKGKGGKKPKKRG